MAGEEPKADLSKYFTTGGSTSEFDNLFPGSASPSNSSQVGVPTIREPTKIVSFVEPEEETPKSYEEAPQSPSGLSPALGKTALMKSFGGDMAALGEDDEEAQEAGTMVSQRLSISEGHNDGGVSDDNEPLSFLAKTDRITIEDDTEGPSDDVEEISPKEEPERKESEPRVFKFEDGAGETSVFDEIATHAVQGLKLDDSPSPDYIQDPMIAAAYGRCRDAWIPSPATREALVMMATAPRGTYVPNKSLLTMPGVRYEGSVIHPLKRAVAEHLSDIDQSLMEQYCPTADSVTQDDRGLLALIERGCYNAAVALTSRLLNMYGQGVGKVGQPSRHTTHSLQLWFIRLMCLTKLRLYNEAYKELEAFGDLDNPDLYLEWSPDLNGGRRGTMVPYSFRLLAATVISNAGREKEALERLYMTESIIDRMISNLEKGLREDGAAIEVKEAERQYSLALWRRRRCEAIRTTVNLCVASKDYRLAIRNLKRWSERETDPDQRSILESIFGRVFLHMGMIERAQAHFTRAWQAGAPNAKPEVASKRKAYFLMDSAYLAIAQNAHDEAYKHFEQLHSLFPDSVLVKNNLAVCRVYQGRVKDAIVILEAAVKENPEAALNEGLVFNLCSMYELVNTPQAAVERRREVLKKVIQHKGDSFPLASLQLPA